MRRLIIVVAAVVGALVVFAGVILFYAATNLNSIIAERRQALLDRVSAEMGRQVQASDIKVSLGWGIMADLKGVQIADEPTISQKPFVEASDVYAKLEVMPLLARRIEVTEVVLDKPVIRLIQTRDGRFNVSSIGKKKAEAANEEEKSAEENGAGGKSRKPSPLPSLFVKNFTVQDGTLVYSQEGSTHTANINAIDIKLRNFGFDAPFDVEITLAALSDKQNLDASATIGPLMKDGSIDPQAIALSAKAKVGPLLLDQLRTIPMIAKSIPPKLSVKDPVSLEGSADGTIESIKFQVSSDLSANEIAFGDAFTKPAGLALKISADGSRTGSVLDVKLAKVELGDIDLKATSIKTGEGRTSARVDTNSFDLGSLSKILPALGKYNLTGKSEVHTDVVLASGRQPKLDGKVTLAGVGMSQPDQKTPPVSNLSGDIRMHGTSADVGPLTFNLGASQAKLSSRVDQLQPLTLSFDMSAGALHVADLAPSRPQDEQLNDVTARGAFAMQAIGPVLESTITSASGSLAGVNYQKLNVQASLEGKRARLMQLKVVAFDGEIVATGDTRLEPGAPFTTSISFSNLNVQQALESQKAKAAGMVQGSLGGNVNLTGKSGTFDEMKPTFAGAGKLTLINGKLIGINVGGTALKKVQNLPGIGDLVAPSVVSNHPELFSDPDTNIEIASLTFTQQGPKFTSHDIKAKTTDYQLLGDGWFDMDKNIDLAAQIVLAQKFSGELIAQKKNIQFLTDRDGQIVVPLQITGQLPKPVVLPNVTELAQRAGQRAVESKGQELIGKYLGKKGVGGALGGLLGGGGGNGGATADDGSGAGGTGSGNGGGKAPPPNSNPPPNPLDQLKKLF